MIATTRLGKAQAAMQQAKLYGDASSTLFEESEAAKAAEESGDKRTLYIAISSDRGLCGSIHSSVSKATRKVIEADSASESAPLVILGDKPKAQLSRAIPENIVLSFNQIGKTIPSFADALSITEQIEASGVEYDSVSMKKYQRSKNV